MKSLLRKTFETILNNYFLLFLYIVLVSYVAYHHEVWRDEADSWLVARDIPISGLFQFTRNSGHPSLWYWVLIPFAKLGFPYYTLTIIHLSFAISTVYLLLFHSTLKKPIIILLIFGYFFFFEYAVVARNYAISNFLLFSIAAIYRIRFEKPILFGTLLFLLANCNIYATIITSGIGLLYLIEIIEEKKYQSKILSGLTLIILGGVVCMIQLIPSMDRQPSPTNSGFFHMINLMAFPISILYSFAPGFISKRAIFGFLILPVGILAFYRVKKIFIFFTFVILLLSFFFTFIFMNGYKHAGFLLLTLIFSLWIKPYYETNSKSETIFDSLSDYLISFFKEPEKLLNVLLTISLLLSVRFSYQESKKDIRYSYSNAKEMANFIISHKLDDKKYSISAHSADKGKTVLYYLQNQKQFYYPGLDSYGSHMWWNKKMGIGEKCSLETAFLRTKEKFIDKENILFLSDKPLKESSSGYELLYYTKSRNEFVKDEEFFLYELLRSEKAQ